MFGKNGPSDLQKVLDFFPSEKVVINTSVENPQWMEIADTEGMAEYFVKGKIKPVHFVNRLEELADWVANQGEIIYLGS